MHKPVLRVLCGLPGAGKTTWADINGGSFLVLSADAIRERHGNAALVFARLENEARRALCARRNVMIDACSLMASQRAVWLALACQCDARAELVLFCVPASVCRARDAARGAKRAHVAWGASCAAADLTARAVQREGWDAVLYVPEHVQAFAYK